MIEFRFGDITANPELLCTKSDVEANLESELWITVDGRTLYQEVYFPVAELAIALCKWCHVAAAEPVDFEFDSMLAEFPGLVWLRRSDHGWRIGSIDQEYPEVREWTYEELCSAILSFAKAVAAATEEKYSSRVAGYVRSAMTP